MAWSKTATYAEGDRVRRNHVTYESVAADNKANDPESTWSGEDAKWRKIGATNRHRCIDGIVETRTEGGEGETLTFSVPFNKATAFALLNMEGVSVTAVLTDTDTSEKYYERNISLLRDISSMSLWEYCYEPLEYVDMLVRTNLPLIINGKLQVSIKTAENSTAKIGHVIVGRAKWIGYTQYDAEVEMIDYSQKKTDEFGYTTIVRRSSANRLNLPIYVEPRNSDTIYAALQRLRGVPCLYQGDNEDAGFSSLSVYGYSEDVRMVYAGYDEVQLTLELQGLI